MRPKKLENLEKNKVPWNIDLKTFMNLSKTSKSYSIQSIKKYPINKTDTQFKKINILKACLKIKGSFQRTINHSVSSSSRECKPEVNMKPCSIVKGGGGPWQRNFRNF